MFAGAAVLFVLAYMTLTFGRIQGEEFSPDVFRRREFSYYEIPLLGLQVWPITHTESTGPLENYLRNKQLISLPARLPEPRWDLVSATRGWGGTRSIMCTVKPKSCATIWTRKTRRENTCGTAGRRSIRSRPRFSGPR